MMKDLKQLFAIFAMLFLLLPITGLAESEEEGDEATKEENGKSMRYIPMDPAFVVNFSPDSSTRFLQIQLQIGTREKSVEQLIEDNRPAIRHNLVFLFSDQKPAGLKSRAGKDELRNSAIQEIQKIIDEEGGKGTVEMVFFTSFVMQ